jgi:DNA-binding Lrp family transcriptional regulator
MFFDDALAALLSGGYVRESNAGLYLGAEPLWQRTGESSPLAIYIPGSRSVKDAEAEQRIEDRKILQRIMDRKPFQVAQDNSSYQLLRWSMDRYGYLKEFPIVVDVSDPEHVLSGRTRLAVARELDSLDPARRLEEAIWASAQRMKVPDASAALRTVLTADVFRRHLTERDVTAIKSELKNSDDAHEELDRAEQVLKSRADAMQRNQAEAKERIREELRAGASRSNVVISKLVGVSPTTVGALRKELTKLAGIHHYEFKGGKLSGVTGQGSRSGDHSLQCWCRQEETPEPDEVPEELDEVPVPVVVVQAAGQSRKTDGDTAGAQAEIRKRVRAGEPVRREEISSRFLVSEVFVRAKAEAEMALWRSELEAAERERIAAEAAEQARIRNSQMLAEWADRENKTVQEYRDAPAVVLDDVLRRLADLRRAL